MLGESSRPIHQGVCDSRDSNQNALVRGYERNGEKKCLPSHATILTFQPFVCATHFVPRSQSRGGKTFRCQTSGPPHYLQIRFGVGNMVSPW